jgi:hypothetical protein
MGQLYLIMLLWMQEINEREIIQNHYTKCYEFYLDDDFTWEDCDKEIDLLDEYEFRCFCEEEILED